MLHADLHLGGSFRAFAQLKSNAQNGYNGAPEPPEVDYLDYNQAFLDYRTRLGAKNAITVRGGRQEISYGGGRLLSFGEGPNPRLSFDGEKAILQMGTVRVDAFQLQPIKTGRSDFDDGTLTAQRLFGVYATAAPLVQKGIGMDLYYLGFDRKQASFNHATANEHRQTFGTRFFGQVGGLDYNEEAAYQGGRFGGGHISAYMLATDTGYTVAHRGCQPRLGLRANVLSGDHDSKDPNLQTFNPMYPRGDFYDEPGFFGNANLMDLRPSLDLYFGKTPTLAKVAVTLDTIFFWRESVRDGLYNSGLGPVTLVAGAGGQYVGTQHTAHLYWLIDRHLTFVVNYAHLTAGGYLHDAGGHDANYGESILTLTIYFKSGVVSTSVCQRRNQSIADASFTIAKYRCASLS